MAYAFFESAFISIFAFYVASQIGNSALVVVLQSGVFTGTIITQMLKCSRKRSDQETLGESGGSSMTSTTSESRYVTNRFPCFRRTPKMTTVWNLVAILCQLGPLAALIFVIYDYELNLSEIADIAPVVFTPIVLIGLSILWCPDVQRWFLYKPDSKNDQPDSTTYQQRAAGNSGKRLK